MTFLLQLKPQVVFQEQAPNRAGAACSLFSGLACAPAPAPVAECTQVRVTANVAIAVPVKMAAKVIPMRAADPSLKKKFRTERMGRLEREYHW